MVLGVVTNMKKTLLILLTFLISLQLPSLQASTEKKNVIVKKLTSSNRSALGKFSSWGVDPNQKLSINIEYARKNFKKKRDIIVAVVDTGVDPNHPYLKKNLLTAKGSVSENNFGIDFSEKAKSKTAPHDSHGHGTHIAGIIKSVFPQVGILTLKYFNPRVKNKYNLDSTIKALEYAVDSGVDIINYSSGGAGASYEELRVLKKAEEKGILVVAAAGNESSNIDEKDNFYFPASYRLKNMITVINHDKRGGLNATSNYGQNTADISAPGSRIKSSYPLGRAGYLTGTSQSTAFVTGVAALLMSHYPNLTTKDVKRIILNSAKKDVKLTKFCKTSGYLDASKAFTMAQGEQRKLASTHK